MAKKLKPIYDYVLVEPQEEESVGSIILPDSAKEKSTRGKVIAVGPGARNSSNSEIIPMVVKINDSILYREWAGTKIDWNDKKMVILKESDIIGIVIE